MSTSETITRTDLTNILNEVLPSTHGMGIYTAPWTSSETSAMNVKVTGDLTLPKGLYVVTIHTPFVQSGIGYIALRVNGVDAPQNTIVAPTNQYARGTYFVEIQTQSTVAGWSSGSASVSYTILERGGIEAVQLVRYTESSEADYIVEQGTSGNWEYRKWNSGRAELWGKFTHTVTAYAANAFIIGSSSVTPYPFAITNPIVQATGIKMGSGACHISYDYERTDYWSGIANPINATVAQGQSREITWFLYVNAKWK